MPKGRTDVGQLMLMLFFREGEPVLRCWLCPAALERRSDYLGHLIQCHPCPCGRCGRVHSGKCSGAF